MSDIYGIMSVAGQALLAQQQAISVTSHNIANVNTPGYSRQQPIMETNTPLDSSIGPMGTGVSVVAIERIYDRFLSAQINNESQGLGRWDAQKDAVELVEMILSFKSASCCDSRLMSVTVAWTARSRFCWVWERSESS